MYFPIVKSLSSLGLVIIAGWLSRRMKIFSSQETKVLAAFIYKFSLPALFLAEIARIDLKTAAIASLAASVLPLAIICIALVAFRAVGVLNKDRFVLYGLCVVFGSNAFFGIPFFEALYGQWGLDMSVLTGSFLSIFGILCSVLFFEYATSSHKGLGFILRIFKSPLVAAILVGAFFSILKPHGTFLTDLVLPLGRTASGTAIFLLGMFLYDHFSLDMVKKAMPLALFRVVALPLVTLIVIQLFQGTDVLVRRFLLLQSGIPAAISIAIFAERYEYKTSELTGMVILTSLASFITLGVLYFLSLRLA